MAALEDIWVLITFFVKLFSTIVMQARNMLNNLAHTHNRFFFKLFILFVGLPLRGQWYRLFAAYCGETLRTVRMLWSRNMTITRTSLLVRRGES